MPNVNTVLDEQVVLKCECVDRIFLNGYVGRLQDPAALSYFLCQHRGEQIPRYEVVGEMTRNFKRDVGTFAEKAGVPVIEFERRARKEDVAAPDFDKTTREGVVLIGTAQERANVFRAPAKTKRKVGKFAATRNSAFVNSYYFYIFDQEWGCSFIKICSYAPFGIRVGLNGHRWLIQQLLHRGISFEPLDNGIASVSEPQSCSVSATGSPPPTYSASSTGGSTGSPTPSPARIALAATATNSPSCSWRSAAPRSSTARSTGASSSRR